MAISFLHERLEHWADRKVIVHFYGGEPLLEFTTMRRIIEATIAWHRERELLFSVTTNGLLLTPEVCEFLCEHGVYCTISLDGTQELHDANRVFRDGRPSWAQIRRNIAHIRARYPDYFATRIQFAATLERPKDLLPVLNAFEKRGEYRATVTGVKPDLSVSEYTVPERIEARLEMLRRFIGYYKVGDYSAAWLYGGVTLLFGINFDRRALYADEAPELKSTGFCRFYSDSAVIQVDGSVSFCNICEMHRLARFVDNRLLLHEDTIGNLYTAHSQFYKEHCANCWVRRLCKLCWVYFLDISQNPNVGKLMNQCTYHRRHIEVCLEDYIRLKSVASEIFHVLANNPPVNRPTPANM